MLHVIYRSYGGENAKGRPDYYSKLLSLASFTRSFQEVRPGDAEILFLNDGPIPQDRLQLMEKWGEVLAYSNLGGKGSIEAALAIPVLRKWPQDDLVWFAEDDYLYLPHALNNLIAAAETFPDASYFGLYAMIGSRLPNGDRSDDRVPDRWPQLVTTLVRGQPWKPALSTTGTFGARVKPLVEDRALFQWAIRAGGAWDHTMSLMYQGLTPFPMAYLARLLFDRTATKSWLRRLGICGARACLNIYQITRFRQRFGRKLVAADPALITHLETSYLALGTDWRSVAMSTQQWMDLECCAA